MIRKTFSFQRFLNCSNLSLKNFVWEDLLHPPGQINHSIVASSTDVTDTDSAQSISSTSSTYLNESNEYTAEDQNDAGDASASTLSGATVWMYVVSGVVLLSLLGIAYRKTVSASAKNNKQNHCIS